MLVYAQALSQTLNDTGLESNRMIYGSQMYYKMMGKTFEGMLFTVQIFLEKLSPEISEICRTIICFKCKLRPVSLKKRIKTPDSIVLIEISKQCFGIV